MRRSTGISIVGVFLMLWLAFCPCISLALSDYDAGYNDGEKVALEHLDGARKAGWFAAGFFTGIIGTLVAYLHKPKATARQYLKENVSDEYERGFVDGFCETITKKRGKWAAIGWGTWVGVYLISLASYSSSD